MDVAEGRVRKKHSAIPLRDASNPAAAHLVIGRRGVAPQRREVAYAAHQRRLVHRRVERVPRDELIRKAQTTAAKQPTAKALGLFEYGS
jgi:hypothetical protein